MMTMMMMLGETTRSNPTVQIPSTWDPLDDPTAAAAGAGINVNLNSPYSVSSCSYGNAGEFCNSPGSLSDTLAALHRFLPSNNTEVGGLDDECDYALVDAFSCDQFRMYEFKVRKCARGRSHDWTECPYAHPGEKARRRDPRKFHYSGNACPDFRKGVCKKGDSCEFAHGVFECWLHPDRYRTQPCKDGLNCRRRVCFFAHTPEQLRHVSPQQSPRSAHSAESDFPSSPTRPTFDSYLSKYATTYTSSPASMFASSPPSDSPPMSPQHGSGGIGVGSPNSFSELMASMRKMKLSPRMQQLGGGYGSQSPRSSVLRHGSFSVPITPTRVGFGGLDSVWEGGCEEEPALERVESGRDLRARIYAKLSKENSLDRSVNAGSGPDVGWVSELVK